MDAETARIMNVTLMGLALMGSGLAVLYESRSQTSYRRTAPWAERTGLPLLDDADPLYRQLFQHRPGECVHRCLGAVKGEQQNAIGALFRGPVAKTQSVEHGILLMRARGPAAKWL